MAMADDEKTKDPAVETAEVSEQTGTDSVPAQETDWKAEARKWEDRAKSNKTRIGQLESKLAELGDASGELNTVMERVKTLEEQNAALERSKVLAEVAAEKQVDAGLLAGDTREELEAFADRLLAWRGDKPVQAGAPLMGYQPENSPRTSDTKQLVRQLFSKE